MPTLAVNKKAIFDYDILEKFEGGLVLTGAETKAAKNGNIQLKGAFAMIRGNQVWLKNAFIGRYKPAGGQLEYDPSRDRKILVHRREIKRLTGKLQTQGLTLVPLRVYVKGNLVKVELGLGRGKKKYEKREKIKKREVERSIREKMKER